MAAQLETAAGSRFRLARPAVKRALKARFALTGPSGSGKTWTGLTVATVLADGGSILVIDTEHGSASLYADRFTFETLPWEPPYDPRALAETVADASRAYAVVMVDSLSHFWAMEGGTMDLVDAAAGRSGGNSFAGWKEGTPAQNLMVESMIGAHSHVIATMRSKTEWVIEEKENARGKIVKTPKRIGLAPVQRQGLEYEFTVTVDLDLSHTATVDKTRCPLLADRQYRVGQTKQMAETLAAWLDDGDTAPEPSASAVRPQTLLVEGLVAHGWSKDQVLVLLGPFGADRTDRLSDEDAGTLLEACEAHGWKPWAETEPKPEAETAVPTDPEPAAVAEPESVVRQTQEKVKAINGERNAREDAIRALAATATIGHDWPHGGQPSKWWICDVTMPSRSEPGVTRRTTVNQDNKGQVHVSCDCPRATEGHARCDHIAAASEVVLAAGLARRSGTSAGLIRVEPAEAPL